MPTLGSGVCVLCVIDRTCGWNGWEADSTGEVEYLKNGACQRQSY